jgi:ATP-dependent RNA helicase RhlB
MKHQEDSDTVTPRDSAGQAEKVANNLPPEDEPSLEGVDVAEPEVESDGEGESVKPPKARPPLYGVTPEQAAAGIDSFSDLPLHETVRSAVEKIGWTQPTPVQKLCLPFTLRGRDVAGFAQTGTGKTAVFLLTIVNKLKESFALSEVENRVPRAIVMAPTRELAMQIEQDAEVMLQHTGLSSLAVFGGIDYDKQAKRLKDGVDIIFATPGRLKDYVQKKLIDLTQVSLFVCDEADRMFDMGFIEDVEFFLERIPEAAQKLLFSATTNEQVKELAFEYLESPEYISVNPEVITPEKIEQHAFHCHATEKLRVMLGLLREHAPECAIVFANTKLTAEWLHFKLEHNGIEADLITGDLPQKKRIRLIQRIKEGKLKALIATDVASRGLHISRVTHVYNFDLPDDPANYVHRIGRTARAGARGFAYSLVCDDYGQNLAGINALLGASAGIVSEWPKSEYLTIEDKAGNPFADRYAAREAEAKARAEARERAAGREGGRDRKRTLEPRSGDQHRGRHGEEGRQGGRRHDRGGHDSRRGRETHHQGRSDSRGPKGHQYGETRHGKSRHGTATQSSAHKSAHGLQSVGKEAPRSLMSIIKGLFKAIFGWGKKS